MKLVLPAALATLRLNLVSYVSAKSAKFESMKMKMVSQVYFTAPYTWNTVLATRQLKTSLLWVSSVSFISLSRALVAPPRLPGYRIGTGLASAPSPPAAAAVRQRSPVLPPHVPPPQHLQQASEHAGGARQCPRCKMCLRPRTKKYISRSRNLQGVVIKQASNAIEISDPGLRNRN